MDKKTDKPRHSQTENSHTDGSTLDGRRKAVGTILAGSGITAAATAGNWSKPLFDAVVLPSHAQTSVVSAVLVGNISSSPVTNYTAPQENTILDFFVGSAHAQTGGPNLSGACLTMTVNGDVFTAELAFVADPAITITGTASGGAFSATGSGVTVAGSLALSTATSSATGTVSNSSGTFDFSVDSATNSCTPIGATTTPAPSTTTVAPGTTTTTTAAPGTTTTTTAAPGTTTTTTAAPGTTTTTTAAPI